MAVGDAKTGTPRWLTSVAAVLVGFMVVVALSTAGDSVMHATGIFPPPDQKMESPLLFLLALAYRGVFTALGGWLTAMLAPVAPLKHALALAITGALAGGLGIVVAVATGLGPVWYAVAVAVTGPLCALAGGWLQARRAAG